MIKDASQHTVNSKKVVEDRETMMEWQMLVRGSSNGTKQKQNVHKYQQRGELIAMKDSKLCLVSAGSNV